MKNQIKINIFKKHIFLFLIFYAFSSLFANQPPDWYLNKDFSYPSSRYISVIGEGTTLKDAENQAVSGLSLYFKTNSDIRNEVIREFNEVIQDKNTNFSKKTGIKESAIITSQEEFLGVQFTSPWFNQYQSKYVILAYIDRANAAEIYKSKINNNILLIDSLHSSAKNNDNLFYKYRDLKKALIIGKLTEELIKSAVVVDSRQANLYSKEISYIRNIEKDFSYYRSKITFNVEVKSDREGRIKRKLLQIIEEQNYITTSGRGEYSIICSINCSEEKYDSGLFVRAGVTVKILDKKNNSLFSYNKTLPRNGHKTLEGAYSVTFREIEKDLENYFISNFHSSLGI